MAVRSKTIQTIDHVQKSSSQGIGGRGRRIKIAMSTMNKNKKEVIKNIEGKEDD